jgi:HEAT repeat protein
MLDQAFDALKSYDWGQEPKVLKPIDEAVVASYGDSAARKELESRLTKALSTASTRDAKDYICRKLMLIGTAECVPALDGLLGDKELSHMARYALERIPGGEAATALRAALSKVSGALKVGVLSSLGARGEEASVSAIAALLGDNDTAVARAAAMALGAIRGPAAAAALAQAKPAAEAASAATDATLACAESLLAAGKKAEALAAYKSLAGEGQPKHVKLAATRGMLACAGK